MLYTGRAYIVLHLYYTYKGRQKADKKPTKSKTIVLKFEKNKFLRNNYWDRY